MKYIKETQIAATPEEVFAFHEQPGALEKLIPPGEPVEVLEKSDSIKPGTRVVLRQQLGPFKVNWVAEHTEYDPPHMFADRQVSGPFARWYHVHRFLDDGKGGTILRDEVDYDLPMGALGSMFGSSFIAKKLDEMFTYRHQITKELVEQQYG